ncbi:MAG: hypothetical protein R2706_19745 [Acidimicrobiales bacterium]
MQFADQRGLETTATTPEAVARLDAAVGAFVTFDSETPARLGESLVDDAAPLALIVFGYLVIQAHTVADHARAAGRGSDGGVPPTESARTATPQGPTDLVGWRP